MFDPMTDEDYRRMERATDPVVRARVLDDMAASSLESSRSLAEIETVLNRIEQALREGHDGGGGTQYQLERLHKEVKSIATMVNWCAFGAAVYVVSYAISWFK